MRMTWRFWLGTVIGFVLMTTIIVLAQPFPAPVQLAVTSLTTGTIPFTDLGLVSGGYINFNTGRGVNGYGIRDNAGTIQFKNSGGIWGPASGGDTTATYLIQVADAALPNAQVLGALGSALLVNTATTGVVTAYVGTTCTNQFVRALSVLGVATCNTVALASDTTGTLPATRGGTNVDTSGYSAIPAITAGTWGPYAGTTCTNQVVSALSALGGATCTTLTSAYVNTSIAVTGADLNAASQVTLTHLAAALPAIQGGTGLASFGIGSVLYANTTTTLAGLSPPGTGNVLMTNGAATAPIFSTLTFPNAATAGDVFYASATNAMGNLPDVAAGSYLRSNGVGAAPLYSTLTLPNTSVAGDLLVGAGANAITTLADVAYGAPLVSQGIGVRPNYSNNLTNVNVTSVGYAINFTAVKPPLLLANVAAYSAIVSTNTETYVGIGSDGLINSLFLNTVRSHLALTFRGIYGVNGASDTLTFRVKLCTVSGCGSGTVVPIAVTAAITPGAAVASQGFVIHVDCHTAVIGGPGVGTIICEGDTTLGLTATTTSPVVMMINTGAQIVDLTIAEYVSLSLQFNNNSASNTLNVYDFAGYAYAY
jgi:hypothetical protein